MFVFYTLASGNVLLGFFLLYHVDQPAKISVCWRHVSPILLKGGIVCAGLFCLDSLYILLDVLWKHWEYEAVRG